MGAPQAGGLLGISQHEAVLPNRVLPIVPVTGLGATIADVLTVFTVTSPVVGLMATYACWAAEGVGPSCSDIGTVVAWPVTCTPSVLALT